MGTSKIGIDIDRDARKIINQRSQIWEEYDRTISQMSELNRYGNTYANAQIAEELAPLTTENIPPTEIAAVVIELGKQKTIIARGKAEIESNLAEIAVVKQQFIKVAGIAGAILAVMFLFLILSHK